MTLNPLVTDRHPREGHNEREVVVPVACKRIALRKSVANENAVPLLGALVYNVPRADFTNSRMRDECHSDQFANAWEQVETEHHGTQRQMQRQSIVAEGNW